MLGTIIELNPSLFESLTKFQASTDCIYQGRLKNFHSDDLFTIYPICFTVDDAQVTIRTSLSSLWWIKFKSGQGDEAADSTDSTARRGNAVLV